MDNIPTIIFNIEDGRLVKLSNTGLGITCNLQEGSKTTQHLGVTFIAFPSPVIRFKNNTEIPIPPEKLQEIAMFFNTQQNSIKFLKGFAVFVSVLVFIPMFLILSMCSNEDEIAKNAKPPEGSIAGVLEATNQASNSKIEVATYDISVQTAWDNFEKQDSALKNANKEKSINEDGSNCEGANTLDGEVWICGYEGDVSEIHFKYLGKLPTNTGKIASVMMGIFNDSENPYTEIDKARILREFKEYSNEMPPFQFPNRWIAINGKFIKHQRLISTTKSGFEINANPKDTPY